MLRDIKIQINQAYLLTQKCILSAPGVTHHDLSKWVPDSQSDRKDDRSIPHMSTSASPKDDVCQCVMIMMHVATCVCVCARAKCWKRWSAVSCSYYWKKIDASVNTWQLDGSLHCLGWPHFPGLKWSPRYATPARLFCLDLAGHASVWGSQLWQYPSSSFLTSCQIWSEPLPPLMAGMVSFIHLVVFATLIHSFANPPRPSWNHPLGRSHCWQAPPHGEPLESQQQWSRPEVSFRCTGWLLWKGVPSLW